MSVAELLSGAPLFGRERDIAAICDLVLGGQTRLITLTGPGGAGKSRLAAAAIEALASTFGDAAVFVNLAAVHAPDLVPGSIAQALDIQESGTRTLPEILTDVLCERPTLLVLDNFEQVRAATLFVAHLLGTCASLTVLVTSRETLNVRHEQVFEVEPLELPDLDRPLDVGQLQQIPSVALFLERAQARRRAFALTDQNARAVAELCVRLDGLPLALELAAAQVAVFSPQAILTRLAARAPLVLTGPRDLPARQQSLDATVAWSYDLLDETERAVFRACSVFAGGWTVEAASAVLNVAEPLDAEAVLQTLGVLVGKSLLRVVDAGSDAPRFGMLETLRAYAEEQLSAQGERSALRQRHAAYYVGLAEAAQPNLRGTGMAATLNQFSLEYPNFREVFRWASEVGDLTMGLRLAGALYRFWLARGHLTEARQWLEPALAQATTVAPEIRGVALNAAGVLAGMQHDHPRAVAFFDQSVDVWQRLDNHAGLANAHLNLGLVAHNRGDLVRAETQFRRAQDLFGDVGDASGMGRAVGSLARLAREAGDWQRALELFERCLQLLREAGDEWGVANSLANLGHLMLASGELAPAQVYFRQALDVRVRLGNMLGVAECLEGLAAATVAEGPRRATVLLGAAAELRERAGAPVPAADEARYAELCQDVRERQPAPEFTRAWADGRALSLQAAIEFATQPDAAPAPDAIQAPVSDAETPAPASPLTRRERQIAHLVALGRSNREVAEELVVGVRTVETHLEHIFRKLAVKTRTEVAVWATQQGQLKPR